LTNLLTKSFKMEAGLPKMVEPSSLKRPRTFPLTSVHFVKAS